MDTHTLIVFVLVSLSVGCIAWAVLPYLTGEIRGERRARELVTVNRLHNKVGPRDAAARRTQVAESMKELEGSGQKKESPSLSRRIDQAGLQISKTQFYVGSVVASVFLGLFVYVLLGSPLYAIIAAFVGGFGLPRWYLNRKRKKRQAKFLNEFPNAVDIIVRGVKAGLPLADSVRIVANEAQEPVRSEFKEIVEIQTVGIPIAEACHKLYERVDLNEANFFAIVIAIQQKTGGSLADSLGNLSRVLRDRKKMRAKIQAVSMEAKTSAGIIGSLPPIIMLIVYLTSPDYISLLWTESMGQLMLAVSAFWMFCGVMVMRKMINFDF